MRRTAVVMGLAACLAAGSVQAADKAEVLARIEAARGGVESFVAKTKSDELVVADVEAARSYLRKAVAAFEGGKQMFGLGGIKPEAEQEIADSLAMADLNIALAESRLATRRNREELSSISALLDKVKAKVQRFDDRKTEMEKLRAEAAKADTLAKEVAQLKADKALLATQVEMLMAERKEWEKLKAEQADLSRKLQEATPSGTRSPQPASGSIPSAGKVDLELAVAGEAPARGEASPASAPGSQAAKGIDPTKQDVPLSELIPLEGGELQVPVKPDAPSPL